MRRIGLSLAAVIGGLAAGDAHAACDAAALATFGNVKSAIATYEQRKRIRIDQSLKTQIVADFCSATGAIVAQGKTDRAGVDAVAQGAVDDCLDAYGSAGTVGTVSAAIRSQLGTNGLSMPSPKRHGLVEMHYAHSADTMKFGSETFAASDLYMLPAGTMPFVGNKAGVPVCHGSLSVMPSHTTSVTC